MPVAAKKAAATTKKAVPRRAPKKVDPLAIVATVKAWAQARFIAESNAQTQESLRDSLKADVEREGVKDDKGSLFLTLVEAVEIPVWNKRSKRPETKVISTLKNERRVTTTLNETRATKLLKKHDLVEEGTSLVLHITDQEKALAVLRAAGILGKEEGFLVERLLDEEAIMRLHYDGKLTEAEIDGIFDQDITFAFKPLED